LAADRGFRSCRHSTRAWPARTATPRRSTDDADAPADPLRGCPGVDWVIPADADGTTACACYFTPRTAQRRVAATLLRGDKKPCRLPHWGGLSIDQTLENRAIAEWPIGHSRAGNAQRRQIGMDTKAHQIRALWPKSSAFFSKLYLPMLYLIVSKIGLSATNSATRSL
jgi:hypothetical protein